MPAIYSLKDIPKAKALYRQRLGTAPSADDTFDVGEDRLIVSVKAPDGHIIGLIQ